MAAKFTPTPEMRPYRPYGAAKALMYCKDREVLLDGPAGTGKSAAALTKLYICCEKYPNIRGIMLRKTRNSLSESGLVTWEEKIVPPRHPCLEGPTRSHRQRYVFPNGSEIIVGGLDNPERIKSSEYDIAYIQECTEIEENDLEIVTSRLRNHKMPYQQLIADTNPDRPTHWLNIRCNQGRTMRLLSRHEDNPVFWDHKANDWTEAGRQYVLGTLESLTGPRKARLRYGIWAGAEGTIYESEWNANIHVIDKFDVPIEWPRYWVIDFGFNNPFVWQEWAENPDGELFRVQEIYKTHTIVEDHAKRILTLTQGHPRPKAIICDHDAEDRATLTRHLGGLMTEAATKAVNPGIEAMKARLKIGENQRPRMFWFRDAVDEIDPVLVDAKKPTSSIEEFDAYVWDTRGGQKRGDVPLKESDHGKDVERYLVAYRDLDQTAFSSAIQFMKGFTLKS